MFFVFWMVAGIDRFHCIILFHLNRSIVVTALLTFFVTPVSVGVSLINIGNLCRTGIQNRALCWDQMRCNLTKCTSWHAHPTKTLIYQSEPLLGILSILTLVLPNADMPCLCKQCRSRSVGFWRSQLIWICTICQSVNEYLFVSKIWIMTGVKQDPKLFQVDSKDWSNSGNVQACLCFLLVQISEGNFLHYI